jgi:hypothetical protein
MTTTTKERPIIFSAPMVQAILDGRKTQTRRIVKPQPDECWWPIQNRTAGCSDAVFQSEAGLGRREVHRIRCPYGSPGDRLWVRETWRPSQVEGKAWYAATCGDGLHGRWRPSIHMPRWASRLTLEIAGVRVERVQDITEADAIAEGIRSFTKDSKILKYWACDPCEGPMKRAWQDLPRSAVEAYATLWESINGPGSWAANPWVWVIEFKRAEGGGK